MKIIFTLNILHPFHTLKKDAGFLPRPRIYLALSSLTFDTSLCSAFDARLNGLLAENVDASKEKLYHLKFLPHGCGYYSYSVSIPFGQQL